MAEYFLTDEYNRRQAARAIPGSWYKQNEGWVLTDPTPRAAAVAIKLFPHLIADAPELLQIREQLAQDVRPIDCATPYWEALLEPRTGIPPMFAERVRDSLEVEDKDFYDYQRIDLTYLAAVLRAHGAAYLGWDRGLGKTLGACALIDELDCQRTLIVCPNTAKQSVWAAELARWCPWVETTVLPNEKAKRERVMQYTKDHARGCAAPRALVIHYEALNVIAKATGGWKRYGEWDMIVADEAHRISNGQAQMTRNLKKIKTKHKLALSGSVIQNHAEELFSQLQWLFPDRYSSKWRDWNDRYLDYVDSGYANLCVGVRIECLAELRDQLGRFMVYRRKEDELVLPLITEETRMVELGRAQRKVYDDLATTFFAELANGETLKASNAISLLTRLRQVATGLDLVAHDVVDSAKLDLATELINDTEDEAFVVFSWFKGAATALAERLGSSQCFVVTGDTKPDDRAESIQRFQAGERRVFIGTISTLGESVTLHRASNVIFLDRSWNPAANEQARDRVYRIGQDKPVTITYIVAADTVDTANVTPTLTDKQALRRMILGTSKEAQAA